MDHTQHEHIWLSPKDDFVLIHRMEEYRFVVNIRSTMPNDRKARAVQHGIEDRRFHHVGDTNAGNLVVAPPDLVQIA